jgi:hypothetical protein
MGRMRPQITLKSHEARLIRLLRLRARLDGRIVKITMALCAADARLEAEAMTREYLETGDTPRIDAIEAERSALGDLLSAVDDRLKRIDLAIRKDLGYAEADDYCEPPTVGNRVI